MIALDGDCLLLGFAVAVVVTNGFDEDDDDAEDDG